VSLSLFFSIRSSSLHGRSAGRKQRPPQDAVCWLRACVCCWLSFFHCRNGPSFSPVWKWSNLHSCYRTRDTVLPRAASWKVTWVWYISVFIMLLTFSFTNKILVSVWIYCFVSNAKTHPFTHYFICLHRPKDPKDLTTITMSVPHLRGVVRAVF